MREYIMFTTVDKAITAFITSLIGILLSTNINIPWLKPEIVQAVTPFITMVATWMVPNKPMAKGGGPGE